MCLKKYVSGFTDSDICKLAEVFHWPKMMAGLSIICLWASVVLHESSLAFNPMSRGVCQYRVIFRERLKTLGILPSPWAKEPFFLGLDTWPPLDQWKELVFILKNTSLYKTVQPGPRCQHLHPGWPSVVPSLGANLKPSIHAFQNALERHIVIITTPNDC